MAPAGRRPVRRRSPTPIATELERFRAGHGSAATRDALAQLAVRLVDPEDRDDFRRADGATTLAHHLAQLVQEQAADGFVWESTAIFGDRWATWELLDCLDFTVIALCHACLDAEMAAALIDLDVISTLLELVRTLPASIGTAAARYAIEAVRNVCFVDHIGWDEALPVGLVSEMWTSLLDDGQSSEGRELAADVLANLAANAPTRASATQPRLAAAVALLLPHDPKTATASDDNLRIAIADLLCNLCADAALCLLVIYELDERRPPSFKRHCGAVYLVDVADREPDGPVKQSLEALAHNVSWSDPAGKRTVQKLGLSSFMHSFVVDPALDN